MHKLGLYLFLSISCQGVNAKKTLGCITVMLRIKPDLPSQSGKETFARLNGREARILKSDWLDFFYDGVGGSHSMVVRPKTYLKNLNVAIIEICDDSLTDLQFSQESQHSRTGQSETPTYSWAGNVVDSLNNESSLPIFAQIVKQFQPIAEDISMDFYNKRLAKENFGFYV